MRAASCSARASQGIADDTCPSSSSATVPAWRAISGWSVMMSSVVPASRRLSTAASTSAHPSGSSPPSGSSRSRMPGRIAQSAASASRFCWPPESAQGARCLIVLSSKCTNDASTRRPISSGASPIASRPHATSSSTVVVKSCVAASWNSRPTLPISGGPSRRSRPAMLTVPESVPPVWRGASPART